MKVGTPGLDSVRAISCLEVKAYISPSRRLRSIKALCEFEWFWLAAVGVVYGCFGTF
jgi:hypothetical protein